MAMLNNQRVVLNSFWGPCVLSHISQICGPLVDRSQSSWDMLGPWSTSYGTGLGRFVWNIWVTEIPMDYYVLCYYCQYWIISYDNNALLGNMIIIQIAIGMWFYDSEIAIIINDNIMIIIMFPFRIAIFWMFPTLKQTHIIMYW